VSLSKLNHVVSLFGLAPDRVFTATPVTSCAVRSYRTISTLPVLASEPSAVYFLLHCPSTHAAQPLAGILLYGARTFLRGENHPRGCPTHFIRLRILPETGPKGEIRFIKLLNKLNTFTNFLKQMNKP